jgi:hypothetical protein
MINAFINKGKQKIKLTTQRQESKKFCVEGRNFWKSF